MDPNINISDANFSLGPITGFFYSINTSSNTLDQLEADGTVVKKLPLTFSQLRNPIIELHFDGNFFWTMEELPSELGMVIKKWRIYPFPTSALSNVAPTELRWQDELTLLNQPNVRYESQAFAIEHYHRLVVGVASQGEFFIKISSVDGINLGDEVFLGPSSFSGFVDNEESFVVTSINKITDELSFFKQGGLDSSYNTNDPVNFTKGIWVFNDHSYSGIEDSRGSLIKFDYPSKELVAVDTGRKYHGVNAADFDQTRISFVRGPMILTINLDASFSIESSFKANLIESDKNSLSIVYDLITDLDVNSYYKLQQRVTEEDLPTGIYTTTDFTPNYNFQLEISLPSSTKGSIATRFEPTRFSITGASPKTRKFKVFAEVRDQFNFPILGKTVQFTATVNNLGDPGVNGTFEPQQDFTNVSGIAVSEYTPSITPEDILMDIKAQVL